MKPEFVTDDGRASWLKKIAVVRQATVFLKPANGTMILRPSAK